MAKLIEPIEAPKIQSNDPVVLELWVRAGGRCEFHGCNAYLLEDDLTTNAVKLANIAHIVGRSKNGPRGNDPLPISERNKIENLMLACTKCHKVIDNKALEEQFHKGLLHHYKNNHEARIRYLTGLGLEHETSILRVIGRIRGDTVSVSNEEVRIAVLDIGRYPRYLGDERAIEIDLHSLPDEVNSLYWQTATAKVTEVITRLVAPDVEGRKVKHLSVFALARIPILIHLGNTLGDKIPTDLYQHHRDEPVGWRWRQGDEIEFSPNLLQKGSDKRKIALMLSLSGKIAPATLPKKIDDTYYIYEISPLGAQPSRSLLLNRETLASFQRTYQRMLRTIEVDHGKGLVLHLFAAIPAPVAVICGRELLKDVDPTLHVYDRVADGYEFALTVN